MARSASPIAVDSSHGRDRFDQLDPAVVVRLDACSLYPAIVDQELAGDEELPTGLPVVREHERC